MTGLQPPYAISGYVLAGGQSSRMGQDKALLKLAGRTLVEHAVQTLRQVCVEAKILSAQPALAAYGPLVPDLHPGCGPLAGMEAALADARFDWCLILPVDVPFLPLAMLDAWVAATLGDGFRRGTRLAMHVLDGRPQPALLLLHRDLAGSLTVTLGRGDYRVMPALHAAAEDLAARRGLLVEDVFRRSAWDTASGSVIGGGWELPARVHAADARLYFANLNTPEEFAEAERRATALGESAADWPFARYGR